MIKSQNGAVCVGGSEITIYADLACTIKAVKKKFGLWIVIKAVFTGLTYRGGKDDVGKSNDAKDSC